MIDEVAPVRGVSQAISSKHIVERVYKNGDGKHIVDQTIYIVTLYDSNGILTTITNSHKINYLV